MTRFSLRSDGWTQIRNGLAEQQGAARRWIRQELRRPEDYVITTRLDNDDILHRDFIATLQRLAVPAHGTAIDLRWGFRVTLTAAGSEIRGCRKAFNPFISLVEQAGRAETMLSSMHHEWEGVARLETEDRTGLWIQLVHDRSLLNATDRCFRRHYRIEKASFGLTGKHRITERPVAEFLSNPTNPRPPACDVKHRMKRWIARVPRPAASHRSSLLP